MLFIKSKGSDEKGTYVKIPPVLNDILQEYLKVRLNITNALFISYSSNSKGCRLSTRTIRGIVKERLRQIGINNELYSAHSLRHTAATINLKAGGTMEETKQLLRHKNITTTLIYSHHLEREKNKSEFRIANVIFEEGLK